MSLAVELRGVYRTFDVDTAPVRALRGVDLVVVDGDFVAVTGPSGSGKSTLVNVIAGLETVDEGDVYLAGRAVHDRSDDELARLRHEQVGMVFQFFRLLEGMTALENVAIAAAVSRSRRESSERARALLDLLGIGDKRDSLPSVLSGGQRQRLAIARALANDPKVLLADEPTGALDSEGSHEILGLFERLHRDGQTIVMVTHDEAVAAAASRRVTLRDGQVDAT